MKLSYTQISTVFLGFCVYVKSMEECDLDCEPGYICRLRRGQCTYPPCPWFPTCHEIHHHHNSIDSARRHEPRHNHRRHHTSQLGALLLSPGSTTNSITTTERPGQCPVLHGPCITTCSADGDCPADKKCCKTGCGQTCRSAVEDVTEKPGTCPHHMDVYSETCTQECITDLDCEGVRKCCQTECGSRCTAPCFYWIHSNQRSGRQSILWKLPFVCRS